MLSDHCLSCLSVTLVYCGQTVGWIRMPLGVEVGLSTGDIVLDGSPASPERGSATSPRFSANVYCNQTARWIKMPLGAEVGLGPGLIVLDGDRAPPKEAQQPTPLIFGTCLLWPNGRLSQQLLSSCPHCTVCNGYWQWSAGRVVPSLSGPVVEEVRLKSSA